MENGLLLLTDLCARLPYGIKAYASEINKKNGIITDVNIPHNMVNLTVDNTNGRYELVSLLDIKPYLRPMSSMTEEEKEEFRIVGGVMSHNLQNDSWAISAFTPEAYDWLNAHHFDYRGLIPKGLAIVVTEENNPYNR